MQSSGLARPVQGRSRNSPAPRCVLPIALRSRVMVAQRLSLHPELLDPSAWVGRPTTQLSGPPVAAMAKPKRTEVVPMRRVMRLGNDMLRGYTPGSVLQATSRSGADPQSPQSCQQMSVRALQGERFWVLERLTTRTQEQDGVAPNSFFQSIEGNLGQRTVSPD